MASMQVHKYRVGEKVNFDARMQVGAAAGEYEVLRLLPVEAGQLQYRIKSALERSERVVQEHQLSLRGE
jgi:hypothetical protein